MLVDPYVNDQTSTFCGKSLKKLICHNKYWTAEWIFIQPIQQTILCELEVLSGFILGGYNSNNMRYADDTVYS